jgi:hypothetical protein
MQTVIQGYREVDRAVAAHDQFVFGHRFGTPFDGERADMLASYVVIACDEALQIADRVPDIQYFQEQRANFAAFCS